MDNPTSPTHQDTPFIRYQDTLETLRGQHRLRQCVVTDRHQNQCIRDHGPPVINLSSNDYLGLAQDIRLIEASQEASARYGTGASSSRLVSGTFPLHAELEERLAQFKQTEGARVFNSGYQGNIAILQAIAGPGDWVFLDALAHASLIDGCLLSRARLVRFNHLDMDDLRQKLAKAPPDALKWIVTESVFSMDGDTTDLRQLVSVAQDFNALTLVDEAHGVGVFGPKRGSGLIEASGVGEHITLQIGTFSKALGSFGGYAAGSRVMMDFLANTARGFIFSTALPASIMAANLKALEIVENEPEHRQALWLRVAEFYQHLPQERLHSSGVQTPIIPWRVGEDAEAVALSERILHKGFFAPAIRFPTVPEGEARLRITLNATLSKENILTLHQALAASP